MASPSKEVLVEAFKAAKVAAEAQKGTDDGGTCNFDSAVVFAGRYKAVVLEAAAEADVPLYESEWRGRKCLFVSLNEGQAYRRTKMAEAACEALRNAFEVADFDLRVQMYYQMD